MNIVDYINSFPSNTNCLTLPQHESWIKSKKSEVTATEYQFNDIELIEDLMDYFFTEWKYEIVDTKIVSDKVGFSVTVTVKLQYVGSPNVFYSEFFGSKYGIASEYAANTKQLTLVTPKAASMAFKNAAKKIGRIFGKDLNRGLENNELPVINLEKQDKKSTTQNLIDSINSCVTTDQLVTYQILAKSNPDTWAIYQQKAKELI